MTALVFSAALALWLVAAAAGPLSKRTRLESRAVTMIVAIIFGAGGLLARVHAFNRSLWLDEFGTLWAIEGGLEQTISRVIDFHGQSPLYYLAVWPLVHWVGESEFLLRLPSFIFGATAVALIYATGDLIGGRRAAILAASVAWLSIPITGASVNARPYALAMLFGALALFGFAGAVCRGRRRYRACFVAGGAGLVLTHFVYGPLLIGIGASYLLFRDLQQLYTRRLFVVDVLSQFLLAMISAPQLMALWARRESLVWTVTPNYLLFLAILIPLAVPALAGPVARARSQSPSLELALWLSIAAQITILTALSAAGTNLLVPRYLDIIAVPVAVAAGLSLARLPPPAAAIAAGYMLTITCVITLSARASSGYFVVVPYEDWRAAVRTLSAAVSSDPAPVLYRSGFVEQGTGDIRPGSILAAPLRGPAEQFPELSLISIPYAWQSTATDNDLEKTVRENVARRGVFYFLSGPGYVEHFVTWLDERFERRIRCEALGEFGGVDLLRCARQ
jgi:hypothetical protein